MQSDRQRARIYVTVARHVVERLVTPATVPDVLFVVIAPSPWRVVISERFAKRHRGRGAVAWDSNVDPVVDAQRIGVDVDLRKGRSLGQQGAATRRPHVEGPSECNDEV